MGGIYSYYASLSETFQFEEEKKSAGGRASILPRQREMVAKRTFAQPETRLIKPSPTCSWKSMTVF
jgi:hypothetical protein